MNPEVQAVNDKTPDGEQTDEQIIADARTYLELCNGANSENFQEAMEDQRILSGDHWPEESKRIRKIEGRPTMVINKLPTLLALVVNGNRLNRISIKVNPVGDGADIEVAEVLQGMIKHIEYESNASNATDNAVQGAASIGFGYYRIVPKYCNDKSFDQDLAYQRIANHFSVAFDPGSIEPDGSDQLRSLVHVMLPKKQFNLEYPDAKTNTPLEGNITVPNWITDTYVRVGEFYRIERTPAVLCLMSDGGIFFEDELPNRTSLIANGITIAKKRDSWKTKVMFYKLTASEILEKTEIMCKWIPVFPVYGTELNMNGKVIRKGIIRDARDPQIMYDYWMTAATEEIAMRNKTPYIGVVGQFASQKQKWLTANNRNYPYLEYDAISIDGQLAPAPQRQQMADIPQGMLTMAMHSNDNIKATTGLFDSSQGNAGNATSGVQEHAQQNQGSLTNSHYQDNLKITRRHDARCLIDMIPHYYDTKRIVNVMREDESIVPITVNAPLTPEQAQMHQQARAANTPVGAPQPPLLKILNDLTTGKYAVVADTGPSTATMRQEASDAMIQFGQSWPKLMDIAGDKVVKAMDWPGAQEIAARIERTIPANIKYDPKDPNAGPPPIPPEAQQQMQQMQQQLQELTQENQHLKSGIDKEMIKAQTSKEVQQMKSDNSAMVAEINGQFKHMSAELASIAQILAAQLKGPPASLETAVDQGNAQTGGVQ